MRTTFKPVSTSEHTKKCMVGFFVGLFVFLFFVLNQARLPEILLIHQDSTLRYLQATGTI